MFDGLNESEGDDTTGDDTDISFDLTDEATSGQDSIENLLADSDKDTMKVIDEQSDFKRFKL